MPGSLVDKRVFLNVPYDQSYEKVLVALTAALVSLGRIPKLTFEIPDGGQGRLPRIFELLRSCRVSMHDLSAVGCPVRFNMPFELGLACALKTQGSRHDFLVLERKVHRVDRHLSDLRGIDAKIHGGTARGAIRAVLDVLERPGRNPSTTDVLRLYRQMRRYVPELKRRHVTTNLYGRRIYGELVAMGFERAAQLKI